MSNQSIIKYNPCFKKVDLVKMKLKTVNPKEEKLCLTFYEGGVEALLYVFEDFDITMESRGIDKDNYDQWKKYFKKVVGHRPLEKWYNRCQSKGVSMSTRL